MTIIAHRAMSLARNDGPDGRGELTKTQTSLGEPNCKTSARSRVQLKEDEGARLETIRPGRAEEARAKHRRQRVADQSGTCLALVIAWLVSRSLSRVRDILGSRRSMMLALVTV